MLRLLVFSLAAMLTACAPSAPLALDADPDHPASPEAPAARAAVEVAALAPVPEPRVPAVLRPDGRPPAGSVAGRDPEALPHGVDHDMTTENPAATMEADEARMAHTAMNHGRTVIETPSPAPPEPLGDVPPAPVTEWETTLDAYLAVHDALASDRVDAEAARRFAAAFDVLAEAPPEDDPHFWHMRNDDVRSVREAADALAAAGDLDAARTAFGRVSAPFVRLAEAAGVTDVEGLAPFTCGMAQNVPEGGVWLQREGRTQNPYFGAAMPMCGSEAGGAGHDHGAAHEHAGH